MKKLFTTLAVGILLTMSASAQYVISTYNPAGQNPGGLNTDDEQPGEAGYTNIIAASASVPAPSWSGVQTIPFNFDFNGATYTDYKVSSTGVLTFTTSATTVPTENNVALPSSLIPDNSIMIWGLKQGAGNDVVRTKTFGAAPLRQHWIYFASYSSPDSPSGQQWTYWGIVLEETSNNIYVVDMRTYNTPLSLTIGIQVDGTTAYQIPSAPNTPSFVTNGGSASSPSDNVYYEFAPPASNNDAMISNVNTDPTAEVYSSNVISGTVKNNGLNTITELEVSWSIDGRQTIHTDNYTGLSLNTSDVYNFTHSEQWTAENAGQSTNFEVWVNIPNEVDEVPANDTYTFSVFVNTGNVLGKRVLLEEFTTAPCQFCPDGTRAVNEAVAAEPSIISVGLHACFSTDAMTIPEASAYCSAFSGGAPTANVDRKLFDGESQVGMSRASSTGGNNWLEKSQIQKSIHTPVAVDIKGDYNSFTRQVNITVSSVFIDYPLPDDLALTLFILEDSVTGTGPGYNQVNYYDNIVGHPYYNKGNPIVGYPHRDVLRDVYPTNNAWGDNTVFPSNITVNTHYTKSYNFTLSSNWDENQVSLVAFVSKYDMSDVNNREVLNADKVKLSNIVMGEGLDAALTSLNIPSAVTDGDSIEIKATVINVDADTLNSLDLNWSIDNGTVYTSSYTNLNLAFGDEMEFTHDDKALFSGLHTSKDVEVWVTNINGGSDDFLLNNSKEREVKVSLPIDAALTNLMFDNVIANGQNLSIKGEITNEGVDTLNSVDVSWTVNGGAINTETINNLNLANGKTIVFDHSIEWTATGMGTTNNFTVWVENSNGSPEIRTTNDTLTQDVLVLTPLDLELISLDVNDTLVQGEAVEIKGAVRNIGAETVSSFVINWSVNGGTIFKDTISNISIPYNTSYNFIHKNEYTPPSTLAAGNLSVYIDKVNTQNSQVTFNDTMNVAFVAIVGINEIPSLLDKLIIYPNPFKAQTNVSFSLKKAVNVSMDVMDVTGKLVQSRDLGKLNAGNHMEIVNADQLESGFYFIRITVGDQITTRKISVIK